MDRTIPSLLHGHELIPKVRYPIHRTVIYIVETMLFMLIVLYGFAEGDAVLKFDARSRDTASTPDQSSKANDSLTSWNAKQTAVIICDMWDKHWCKNATKRVGEMVPKMNQLIDTLRDQGVMMIHAPSGTMDYYKDTPQRKKAIAAAKTEPPVEIQGWCHLEPSFEIALPIDDSDEGCDDDPPSTPHGAWTSQHPDIHIG